VNGTSCQAAALKGALSLLSALSLLQLMASLHEEHQRGKQGCSEQEHPRAAIQVLGKRGGKFEFWREAISAWLFPVIDANYYQLASSDALSLFIDQYWRAQKGIASSNTPLVYAIELSAHKVACVIIQQWRCTAACA
jgi:hypothetical protein